MVSDRARAAAGLISIGFDGKQLSPSLKEMIDLGIGGVVLFSRNIGNAEEVARLIFDIKRYADRPIICSLDQEGGRVQRLKDGFTPIPSMRRVGQVGNPALTRELGALIGRELRAVGVDLNFAPVLDVDTNPNNPVIGDRSFGMVPELVAHLGVALGEGMESEGVASCGKHFPGHGDTDQDSHFGLPSLKHKRARLEKVELIPFLAWCNAGLSGVMSAHIVMEAFDGSVPATMAHRVLRELLREQLGFEGIVFSDDMEMGAIVKFFGHEEACIRALAAGVDHFLICHSHAVARTYITAIESALGSGQLSEERVCEAQSRTASFTNKWVRPPATADLDMLDTKQAQSLIARLQTEAIETGTSQDDPTEAMGSVMHGRRNASP